MGSRGQIFFGDPCRSPLETAVTVRGRAGTTDANRGEGMSACESSSFDLEDRAVVVDAAQSGERPAVQRDGLVAQQRSITHRRCDCCDGEIACVRGIVLDDGRTAGVYFATFVVGHPQVVRVALGLANLEGPQTSALLDLSIIDGKLSVDAVGEEDVEPFRRFAEAIHATDELVGRYLAAPRTSIIREIR